MHANVDRFSPVRFLQSTPLVAVLLAAMLSCSSGQDAVIEKTAAQTDSRASQDSAARAGVERSMAVLAAAEISEQVDTIVSYYSEDFLMRRPGEPDTRGRDGIRARFKENFAGWAYERPLLTIDRFASDGSLAVTGGLVGGILREKKPGAAPQNFEFPYLASWIRAQDGRWLLRDLMVLPGAADTK